MWPWWVMIPLEDFTDEYADRDDEEGDEDEDKDENDGVSQS